MRSSTLVMVLLFVGRVYAQDSGLSDETAPLSAVHVRELVQTFEKLRDESATRITKTPDAFNAYSQHGDACFFLGRFSEAVVDYDKMIELDPSQQASHWRRGIALFYDSRFKDAASQFESYHSIDQVDRENGIWRYLSQHRAYGAAKAREGLLKYKKDDREPFPAVYKLFAASLTPEQILAEIAKLDLSKEEREKRSFYAHLYIGLNYAVEDKVDLARRHLAIATRNTWAPEAGYGPNYMWNVGRLHEELLRKELQK